MASAEALVHDDADFELISEVVWDQWRTSVVRHGLGGERLGRFAPSLRGMTRVIWNRTLGEYAHQSLGQIRELKTHGEKRVRALLEVFRSVHTLVANMGAQRHLVVRHSAPRLIDQVEGWVERMLQAAAVPSEEDLFENYTRPLLEQIRIDANDQMVRLAENRLGLSGPITSVRQAARTMGLTRRGFTSCSTRSTTSSSCAGPTVGILPMSWSISCNSTWSI